MKSVARAYTVILPRGVEIFDPRSRRQITLFRTVTKYILKPVTKTEFALRNALHHEIIFVEEPKAQVFVIATDPLLDILEDALQQEGLLFEVLFTSNDLAVILEHAL